MPSLRRLRQHVFELRHEPDQVRQLGWTRCEDHDSDLTRRKVLLVGQILIERDQNRKGGLFSLLDQRPVFKIFPSHVLRGVDFTVFGNVESKRLGHVVVEQDLQAATSPSFR